MTNDQLPSTSLGLPSASSLSSVCSFQSAYNRLRFASRVSGSLATSKSCLSMVCRREDLLCAPSERGSKAQAFDERLWNAGVDRRGRFLLGGSSEYSLGDSAVRRGSTRADCMRWYVTVVCVRAERVKNGARRVETGIGRGESAVVLEAALSSSSRYMSAR